MRKSKAETAETRKRIVAVASNLFMTRGLSSTGVADVMVAAGLTQGAFYRHFESKEQLIAEASAAAFAELFAMFDSYTAGKPAPEALQMIVQRYLYQLTVDDAVYLCPLANLGSELRHGDAEVRGAAGDGYAGLVKMVAAHLMRMDVVNYVAVAESLVATMVGAVSLSRLAVEPAASNAILANAEQTIHSLLRNAATSKTLH